MAWWWSCELMRDFPDVKGWSQQAEPPPDPPPIVPIRAYLCWRSILRLTATSAQHGRFLAQRKSFSRDGGGSSYWVRTLAPKFGGYNILSSNWQLEVWSNAQQFEDLSLCVSVSMITEGCEFSFSLPIGGLFLHNVQTEWMDLDYKRKHARSPRRDRHQLYAGMGHMNKESIWNKQNFARASSECLNICVSLNIFPV